MLARAAACSLPVTMLHPGCPLHAGQVLDKLDKHTSGDVKSPGQAYEEEQVGGSSLTQSQSLFAWRLDCCWVGMASGWRRALPASALQSSCIALPLLCAAG